VDSLRPRWALEALRSSFRSLAILSSALPSASRIASFSFTSAPSARCSFKKVLDIRGLKPSLRLVLDVRGLKPDDRGLKPSLRLASAFDMRSLAAAGS